MPTNEANVSVRFSTKDSDLVKKALQDLGAEGQKVLDRLERATSKPSDGLKVINAVMADGKVVAREYASSVGVLGTALTAIGPAGVGAAAAIGGLAAAAKFAFNTLRVESEKVGALKDVAERIGFTTDALQELRFAALESGVEQEKLGNALTRFSFNVGQAAEGTGGLADELHRYGINVVNADKSTRDSGDILRDYANAIKHAHSDQERLRLAIAAFGKDGAGMVSILKDGAAGLDEFKAQAHATGLVLGKDLIENAKKFNDELERLEANKSAALQRALFGDAPAEEAFKDLDNFNQWLATIEGTMGRILHKYGPSAGNFLGGLLSGGTGLAFKLSDYFSRNVSGPEGRYVPETLDFTHRNLTTNLTSTEVQNLSDELNKLVRSTEQVAEANAKYQRGLEIINKLVADGSPITGGATAAINALTDAYNEVTIAAAFKATPAHKSVEAALYGQTLENEKLLEAMKKSEYEYDVTVRKLKLVKDGFEGTAEAADAYARKLVDQEHQIRDTKQAWDDQANAAKKAAEDAVRNAEAMARAVNRFAQDMGSNVIDAFINMAEGAKNPFDRLLNYARQTFTKMAAEAILNPIIVPLISQLVGAVAGGAGGGFASGAGGMASGASALMGLGGTALGGAINSFGATYLNTGISAASMGLPAELGTLGGPLLTSYLGAGALGGLGGYLLADLTGMKNKSYAAMGAGGGAMIGMAAGGPIGALAGALIGSLAGLLGPGPSDKLQGDWLNFNTGSMSAYGYTGNKYSAQNAQSAGALGTSLLNFGNLLTGAGLRPNFATNARVEAGSNGSPFRVWYGGINGDTGSGVFQDPQAAFKAVASEILKSLTDVPANLQRVIDGIDYTNLEKFAEDLNDALQWTSTVQDIRNQLQVIKDPKGAELSQLDALFNPLKEKARETGEGLAEIEELYGIRRRDILARYAEGAAAQFNLGDAWSAMNNAEGRGFLNDIQGAVGSRAAGLSAAGSNATGQEWVNRTFSATLRNILGNGSLTVDQLTLVKNTFANIPEVVTAANDALANLLSTAGPTAEALARLPSLLQEAANAQIDLVKDQIDGARSLQSFYQNAAADYRNAATSLDLDSSTSAGTLADQFALAQSLFEGDRSKALLGDQGAIDILRDEGANFVALAKQMFGSSSQFVQIQQRVKDTFLRVADLSDRQGSIATQSLNVALAQLDELRRIAAGGTGTGAGGNRTRTTTAADLDALNASFGSVYGSSGMTAEQFMQTGTYGVYKSALISDIGGLADVNRLTSDLNVQAGRITASNPDAFAQNAPEIAKAIVTQLGNIGVASKAEVDAVNLSGSIDQLTSSINNLLARIPRAA